MVTDTYQNVPHRGQRSRRRRLAAAVAGVALVLSLGVPATSAVDTGEWHRDNYGAGHERLTCIEGAQDWQCSYQGNDGEITGGRFNGRNVTDSWECPDWFSPEICDPDNLVAVYGGNAIYVPRAGQHPVRVAEDYVLTSIDGQAILYLYWHEEGVGVFYCPWFRTFEEALDAPFECTFRDGPPS